MAGSSGPKRPITSTVQDGQSETALNCAEPKQLFQEGGSAAQCASPAVLHIPLHQPEHTHAFLCVAATPSQGRYFSNINQSVLTPESVLWCCLHSCQSNDALFSGTSCKTAAAIERCRDRKPSTGPSWVPRPHAPLQDTWCSCRGFSAALHPLPTACSVSRDHSRTVRRREGLRPLLQHSQCATLLESPCPGHRGTPRPPGARYSPFQSAAGGLGRKSPPGQGISEAAGPL